MLDGSSDFEQELPPDYCDTPELQAAWRRVEAFDASQPVCEKLADLAKTLVRVAEIILAEQSPSLSWAQFELEKLQERVKSMSPAASRPEFERLTEETLSSILSEPKLHAAYDAASSMEMLEIVAPQIEALRGEGERNPLSDDERRQLAKLDDLRATLDEEVCNGFRRLRSFDS